MNGNNEWKMSLEDALREIHRQLMEDEIFLNRRLQQGSFMEELPDEEMRIRRIFSLAVLMEETIDHVLKEIESGEDADGRRAGEADELQSLEYKSHTIGTPDDGTPSPDIEDISIDSGDDAVRVEVTGGEPLPEEGAAEEPEAEAAETAEPDAPEDQPDAVPAEEDGLTAEEAEKAAVFEEAAEATLHDEEELAEDAMPEDAAETPAEDAEEAAAPAEEAAADETESEAEETPDAATSEEEAQEGESPADAE